MKDTYQAAAYGGEGWSPRLAPMAQEIGSLWGACGVDTEWAPLQSVLLHRPGGELADTNDPNLTQQLAPVDLELSHPLRSSTAERIGIIQAVARQTVESWATSSPKWLSSVVQTTIALVTGQASPYLCGAVLDQPTVSVAGDVYPCHTLFREGFRMGSVTDPTLFAHETFAAVRR